MFDVIICVVAFLVGSFVQCPAGLVSLFVVHSILVFFMLSTNNIALRREYEEEEEEEEERTDPSSDWSAPVPGAPVKSRKSSRNSDSVSSSSLEYLGVAINLDGRFEKQGRAKKPIREYESDLVVVLDLDECLIHSQFLQGPGAKYAHQVKRANGAALGESTVDTFNITLPDGELVRVNERPQLRDFLARVSEKFETHIFTAGIEVYALAVKKMLDPHGTIFTQCWSRESCTFDSNVKAYVKKLDFAWGGDKLKRTVLVDNNRNSFLANPENGILVKNFYDDPEDSTLTEVLDLLYELDGEHDVRPVLDARYGLKTKLLEISKDEPPSSSTTTISFGTNSVHYYCPSRPARRGVSWADDEYNNGDLVEAKLLEISKDERRAKQVCYRQIASSVNTTNTKKRRQEDEECVDASPKKRIRIEKPSSVKATHNEDVKKESTQNEDIKKESSSSTSPSPTTTTISLNATNTKKRRQEDEECVLDLDECLIHSQFLDEPMSVHSSCHIIVEDVSESEAGFVNSTAPPPSDAEPQPAIQDEDVKKESTQNEDITPANYSLSDFASDDSESMLSQELDQDDEVTTRIVVDVSESEAGFVNSTAPPPSDVEPQPAIQDSSSCRRKKASGPLRRSARLAGKGLGSFYVGRVRRSARLALLL